MSTEKLKPVFVPVAPWTVPRQSIRDTVGTYLATYPAKDIRRRVSLFADPLRFEDPAGLLHASSRDELERFYAETLARGVELTLYPQRLIVTGDEALQAVRLLIAREGRRPTLLQLYLHFVFDCDGLIAQLRTFFDEDCSA